MSDIKELNQLSRRARQGADDGITFQAIPLSDLSLACHSDTSLCNAAGSRTQAGYIIGAVDRNLNKGQAARHSPIYWKSYRLKRVVGSTLSAESQAMRDGMTHMVWFLWILAEATRPDMEMVDAIREIGGTSVTDAKSAYDALRSPSSPCSIQDKLCAVDLIILKETPERWDLPLFLLCNS